jgi:propanol-preferring alcohol dehydrogenase
VDGGYADFRLVEEAYAYRLSDSISDEQAAPLLCAGIIGYRSLLRANMPPGGARGLYGFGGSAHLTPQLALHLGMRVHMLTRGEENRKLARELVPVAMRALAPGGTLPVAGIWLSDIPVLHYENELFHERRLCSVTANTRADGEEFLRLAARFAIRATTTAYPMSQADRAMADLAHGRFSGAAVLHKRMTAAVKVSRSAEIGNLLSQRCGR